MKKMFSLIVVFALSLTMMTSVSAAGFKQIDSEVSLCFETATVPANVTTYAADIFMHMSKSVWSSCGITDSQLNNLTLSQGFRMISVDTMQYSDIAYYFLVCAGDSVVGIITISNENGELGFQIERNHLAVDISERMRPSTQPYKIYVSDNAYYFVQNNRIIHTSSEEYKYDKDKITNDCSVISNNLASYTDNVMNTTIAKTSTPIATCSFSNSVDSVNVDSFALSVVHVNNKRFACYIKDENGNKMPTTQAVCWAACTASLCNYFKRGCPDWYNQYDLLDAERLRDDIVSERYFANDEDLTTGLNNLPSIINEKLLLYGFGYLTYEYIPSILPWNVVTISIDFKYPSITGWYYRDNNLNEYDGHVMVLKGFSYSLENPNQDSYYAMHFMNPNTQAISLPSGDFYPSVIVGYNAKYYIDYNKVYNWEKTVCLNDYT